MLKYNVNNIYRTNVNKYMTKPPDDIDKLIDGIKNYLSKLRPGEYIDNYSEDYLNKSNKIYARGVALCIERDEEKAGYARLIVALLHPSKNVDASSMIIHGDINSIKNSINQKHFKQEVISSINQLSESLKEYK